MTRPISVLPPTSAHELAIAALTRQGQYGAVAEIALQHGVDRHKVYELRDRARGAIEAEFAAGDGTDSERARGTITLEVSESDIARTVIALRVVTPASIRDEVAMLPIIYGHGWSYGKIQGLLVQAEGRARDFLAGVDLSAVESVALDEVFSAGTPIFGGIDLDTGFLFALERCPTRNGAEWYELLAGLRDERGLRPGVVVKDAGQAMARAVDACFPEAEQRDDLFHAVYLLGQVGHHLERRAYSAIAQVEDLGRRLRRARTGDERRRLSSELSEAQTHAEHAIDRFDRFDVLAQDVRRTLALADRGSGRLRTSTEVVGRLTALSSAIEAVGGHRARKIAGYLRNRAPGLARYLDALAKALGRVAEGAGGTDVVESVIRAWQASVEVHKGGPSWDRKARHEELEAAVAELLARTGRDTGRLRNALGAVLPILAHRHRASSAIENFNSVLRPYLVVQKNAQQGFLDLFRFYWNLREREWGPHKGTSAYEMLTGKRVDDWLALLGYPPSTVAAAAA